MKRLSAPVVSLILHLAAAVVITRGHARPPAPKVRLQVAVVNRAKPLPPPPTRPPVVALESKPAPRPVRA